MLKVKLGDIIRPRREKVVPSDCPDLPFIGMEHIEAHTMRLLGTVPAGSMRSAANRFFPGDVLYGRLRPYLNKVYKPTCTGLCSAEFIVFPQTDGIVPDFLKYLLNSQDFVTFASQLNAGDRPRVDFDQLSSFDFFLPSYLAQQRTVAEIEKQFSRLDEAVANLKRVKANLKRYKAAVLKAAVEGKLTEEWRQQHPDVEPADKLLERILAERRKAAGKGKYKEPVGPDTSGLPELPAGWVWASLESISDALGGFAFKSNEFSDTGAQVVKMGNIKMGRLELSQNPSFIKNVPDEIIRRYKLDQGDILITLTGTKNKGDYGYVVQIGHQENVLLLNQRIARLRFYIQECSLFSFLALQGDEYRRRFFRHETGNVGQGNVGIRAVTIEPIPLPPLAEQHQIVAEVERRLSIVAGAEAQVDANLRRADRLRQSILKQAFSCKLVPQEPNDETASVLLERIRANPPSPQPLSQRARGSKAALLPRGEGGRRPGEGTTAASAATTGFTCLDDLTAALLAAMQPGREYARADLADPLGLTTGQWNVAIQELKRVGKVRQTGEKRGARYTLIK